VVEEPGEGDEDDVEGEEVAEAARWGEEGRGEAEDWRRMEGKS
jgi:hypothetical protein